MAERFNFQFFNRTKFLTMDKYCSLRRRLFRFAAWLCALTPLVFLEVGCSRNSDYPPLGRVEGVITLDGQPLADADVTFQPEGPGSRASVGTTDAQGRYELVYLNDVRGAMVGPHRVMITTARSGDDNDPSSSVREKLPDRYHRNSDTRVEVVDDKNTFDFALESK